MNEKKLKSEAERLMKIPGNVKGAVFQTHAIYVHHRQGEKGVKMVEEQMGKLGYPLKFSKIKTFNWYPEALNVLTILTIKELFNWTEKDVIEMGNFAPKYSLVMKILLKYFVSVRKVFESAPIYWKKHFDFSDVEPYKIDEEKKYAIVRIKGHKFHPVICREYRLGYILRFVQFAVKSEKIEIKETKCVFNGDPFDEYTVSWD